MSVLWTIPEIGVKQLTSSLYVPKVSLQTYLLGDSGSTECLHKQRGKVNGIYVPMNGFIKNVSGCFVPIQE